jgi:two-component system LytT family response regulator
MAIKAIIIDDERLARNELKKLLQVHPEIEIIEEAANVDDGIEKIESMNPELIFLDIQMPGKTGFDLLTEVEKAPKVIFTTAYDEYAIKAFEVNALDYLQKPIEPKRLSDAIQKLQMEIQKERAGMQQGNRGPLTEEDQVFVKDREAQ